MIRKEVAELVKLGAFSSEDETIEEEIERRADLLDAISKPLTDEEAEALLPCFGPDDYYGVAWTLLHLIESAPGGCPVKTEPPPGANEWIRRLWDSAERGRRFKLTGSIY
jgi:hypothetical protein